MDASQLWKISLETLRAQMTRATFDTWLRGSQAADLGDGLLTIAVASDYAKDWLENRLYDTILRTTTSAGAVGGVTVTRLAFVVSGDAPAPRPVTPRPQSAATKIAQPPFPGFEPLQSNFVQVPKQFFEVVMVDGSYVMRIFVGAVIANTYGRIVNFRTHQRAEWWEASRPEIMRATGIRSVASVDKAIAEARARGFIIRDAGMAHYKYRPREENEPIDTPE